MANHTLFDDFLVLALHHTTRRHNLKAPNIHVLYHMAQNDQQIKPMLPFTFPDAEAHAASTSAATAPSATEPYADESFTFTLTQDDGSRSFGFCRRLPRLPGVSRPVCLCVLSRRPWFSLFMRFLDIVRDKFELHTFVPAFVTAMQDAPLPRPGECFAVDSIVGDPRLGALRLATPVDDRPTGLDLEPLFSSLGIVKALRVLAALMLEQRVVFVADSLSKVSACAHGVLSLLYPLEWQHIFIPILPPSMISYVCAPMPFVLGVMSRDVHKLENEPMDTAMVVNLEDGCISGDASLLEEAQLPRALREPLERQLSKLLRAARLSQFDSCAAADSVIDLLMVRLLGHYEDHIDYRGGDERLNPDFDDEGFVAAAVTPSAGRFLRGMRSSQLFEHWIRERIAMSAEVRGESAFEKACLVHTATHGSPDQQRLSRRERAGDRARAVMSKASAAMKKASHDANQAAHRASERAKESGARMRSSAAPSLKAVAMAAQQRAQAAQAKARHSFESVKMRLQSPEAAKLHSPEVSRLGIWRELVVHDADAAAAFLATTPCWLI